MWIDYKLPEGWKLCFARWLQPAPSFFAQCLVVQLLSCVSLWLPWTAACQASQSITISQSLCKCMSIESVMPSNHVILCHILLLLPSIFPSIRIFSNELMLCIRLPKYWSFSISLSNEYSGLISFGVEWFDLLLSKGFSRVFLSSTVQKYSFSVLSLPYGPTMTSIHDYWKNHSFDQMDLFQQRPHALPLCKY